MSKHTPGPYKLDGGEEEDGTVYVWTNRPKNIEAEECVCTVHGDLKEGTAAGNAALIIGAPDLLTELRDFHDHTIDMEWHDCEGIPGGCPVASAIAKAEGKVPIPQE